MLLCSPVCCQSSDVKRVVSFIRHDIHLVTEKFILRTSHALLGYLLIMTFCGLSPAYCGCRGPLPWLAGVTVWGTCSHVKLVGPRKGLGEFFFYQTLARLTIEKHSS